MTAAELWAQLDAYAKTMEKPVREAFLAAVAKVRASLTEEELAHIVRSGDMRVILDRLDLTQFKLAYQSAILSAAGVSMGLPFDVRFDALNYNAIRAMQDAQLRLVQGLSQEVQDGIRTFLVDGLRNGVNPRDTAADLRGIVGLSARDAQAVANYRALLTGGAKGQPYMEAIRRAGRDGRFDRTILNALSDRTPIHPSKVKQIMDRYEERTLKRRAETIARTNTMDALAVSQHLKWQQAVEQGEVQESELRRFWHTAKDERTCPICSAIPLLNPKGVALGQPFLLPGGGLRMGPTIHPNCRCIVVVKIVYAKMDLVKIAWELSGLAQAA